MTLRRPSTADTLTALRQSLHRARATTLGFPPATDIDYSPVQAFHAAMVNNIGDPERDGLERRNAKGLERDVLRTLLGLFGGDTGRHWGYVTQAGSTEGNQWGMWLAREHHPDAVLYHSGAAHYSVSKAARALRMADDVVVLTADDRGEMDYGALARAAAAHPGRPAIVVATAGTTMTEAVDDVTQIHAALSAARVPARYLHLDAALAGVPLALAGALAHVLAEPDPTAPTRGDVNSLTISGHKFFGTPTISGVALARREHVRPVARGVDYIDGLDATLSGSRSGQAAIELWYALHHIGIDGHRRRSSRARELAAYTVAQLQHRGWRSWRHPQAFTVLLHDPPPELARRWALPTSNGWAHLVCVPGVTTAAIDTFLEELGTAAAAQAQHLPEPHHRIPLRAAAIPT